MADITRRTTALLAGAALVRAQPTTQEPKPVSKAFAIEQLRRQLAAAGRPYLPFLNVSSMRMGVYSLAAGADDKQQPHDEDEIYYVLRGKAVLRVGKEEHPAEPGAVLFVAARATHKFVSITEPLELLVFFSTAK